ncbi:flavin reductase family protein [Saccharopolyspora gregorii]|uniref:flavin reductase family protein n=1 Tax=Saccharopolyspora gregorii TaxID=33914 RepID=UPI0021AC0EC5|nr:flavin reductase family protein [Saccharopolyspora gregorii]
MVSLPARTDDQMRSTAVRGETLIPPDEYRDVLGRFCTGITIVAGIGGGRPRGFACQSFSAVSLDPPLVLICPGRGSTSWPRIRAGGRFTVNVLAEHQGAVCAAFGSSGGSKFDAVDWRSGPAGEVLLDGVLAWIHCQIESIHDGGDHEIVVGRVTSLRAERGGRPLLFYRGRHDLDVASSRDEQEALR